MEILHVPFALVNWRVLFLYRNNSDFLIWVCYNTFADVDDHDEGSVGWLAAGR